jgi:hypothetical protein
MQTNSSDSNENYVVRESIGDDELRKREDYFNKLVDDVNRRKLSNNENFDKHILTLSSAALGLSISFLQEIELPKLTGLLIVAWIFLCLAIALTILSFLTSQKGLEKHLENAERYFKGDEKAMQGKNHCGVLTDQLAVVSATFFCLAIFLLVAFFYANLPSDFQRLNDNRQDVTKMNKKNNSRQAGNEETPGQKFQGRPMQSAEIQGGASMPSIPKITVKKTLIPPPPPSTEKKSEANSSTPGQGGKDAGSN